MNFKEQLTNDLDTFFNPDEFAELHTIEGKKVMCVVDTDVMAQRSAGTSLGVSENDIQVFAKTEELEKAQIKRKGYGAPLNLDGRELLVVSWNEKNGACEIALSQATMN